MIDVTEIILNYQKLLVPLLQAMVPLGLDKGCDVWDELTENAYDLLVRGFLQEKYNFYPRLEYEVWGEVNSHDSIIVNIKSNSKILISKGYVEDVEHRYVETLYSKYSKNEARFFLIEFGHPFYQEDNSSSFDYVMALDKSGNRICVHINDCRFFIEK